MSEPAADTVDDAVRAAVAIWRCCLITRLHRASWQALLALLLMLCTTHRGPGLAHHMICMRRTGFSAAIKCFLHQLRLAPAAVHRMALSC